AVRQALSTPAANLNGSVDGAAAAHGLTNVAFRPRAAAPDLSALNDPDVLSNPDRLRSLYRQALEYSQNQIDGLNPSDTSLSIAQSYSNSFASDPTAVWFGLAPYA